jgi:KDO2-lipid IV(A) lauroyltransferase
MFVAKLGKMLRKAALNTGIFFLYLVSLLPFWFLYGVADVIFLFLYYIIRYRRDVVSNKPEELVPGKERGRT